MVRFNLHQTSIGLRLFLFLDLRHQLVLPLTLETGSSRGTNPFQVQGR